MFRIRREQLEWFARQDQIDFVRRMSPYLRDAFPELVMRITHEPLEAWLERVIEKSLSLGIETEADIAQLALFWLLMGIDCEEREEWVRPILRDRELQPVGRLRRLVDEARLRGVKRVDDIDLTHTLEAV